MSNNAAVTADGGEIGRAQALQARACNVRAARRHEPGAAEAASRSRAQVVVAGQAARARFRAPRLPGAGARAAADACSARSSGIAADADLVLVEGAGSPAEINLRPGDIANMGFAEAADVPVALVGDIDRGGVIAQLVGTHALLSAAERARLAGTIVNKFRGDKRLFDGGLAAIEERTGLPCFGVVPWFPEAHLLPAEDSLALRNAGSASGAGALPQIAVPLLPHIANFDDLDPLRAEPGVELVFVRPGQALPGDAALIILPGSKATLADLAALRREGWDIDIVAHRRRGGEVLGICGGYQMLGRNDRRSRRPRGARPKAPPGLACSISRRCWVAASISVW